MRRRAEKYNDRLWPLEARATGGEGHWRREDFRAKGRARWIAERAEHLDRGDNGLTSHPAIGCPDISALASRCLHPETRLPGSLLKRTLSEAPGLEAKCAGVVRAERQLVRGQLCHPSAAIAPQSDEAGFPIDSKGTR